VIILSGATLLLLMVGYLIPMVAIDVWFMRRAARRVQDAHPEVWAAIGAKSLHSPRFSLSLGRGGMPALADPELNALFRAKRRFDWISGGLFLLVFGFLGVRSGVIRWPLR
jgi:hypothetical protein